MALTKYEKETREIPSSAASGRRRARSIESIDWNFNDAVTHYATHGLHPYPAKFIPQIPRTLIEFFSKPGELVLDPFCGSGTTLVEALLAGRSCIGIDASPLACLISRAKTARLGTYEANLLAKLLHDVQDYSDAINPNGNRQLFVSERTLPRLKLPTFEKIDFWFDRHVIEELALIKFLCKNVKAGAARDVALTAFSSIVVSVSRQDSDTRYVRRQKVISRGETLRRFARSLSNAVERCTEFSPNVPNGVRCTTFACNILQKPKVERVDLVVCSPPYPNAYSYHLYHRNRMLWLDMDQATFKKDEIGSHRKYSRKAPIGVLLRTFREELASIFAWLHTVVRPHKYACFIIGDSIIQGQRVDNANLLTEVATRAGFGLNHTFRRVIKAERKYFNPVIGKIREESVIVLQNK